MSLGLYIKATRPQFLTASILPVILGSLLGAKIAGELNILVFTLSLVAMMLLHAAANVINDVADHDNGADLANEGRLYPFTGGSRMIQNGTLARDQMARFGLVLLGLSVLPGAALAYLAGWPVIALGVAGMLFAWAYSFAPFKLASRGLGELSVGLAFGLLPVVACVWLQSGQVTHGAWLLGGTVSIWIACVLLINAVPDALSDAVTSKRTLCVRLGLQGTRWVYLILQLCASGSLFVYAVMGLIPIEAAFAAILLGGAAYWVFQGMQQMGMNKDIARFVIKLNLTIHSLGCVLLTLGVLF